MGPLRVHPDNPRYFADPAGRPVLLVGSHEGWELQDDAWNQRRVFDYDAYLDLLVARGHSVIRMWCVETTRDASSTDPTAIAHPMPFQRTGPGRARDGQPKFDLDRFDQAYFDRLRTRVEAARDRGLYVIVMLFQGVSIRDANTWFGHYLNAANNVNGVNGDQNRDGSGQEVHTLANPRATDVQLAYVRKVIETVNDLDNVLYEVANESRDGDAAWQYRIIRFVKSLQATLPNRHPIGMTFRQGDGTNAELFTSEADWISPKSRTGGFDSYRNPPEADGAKVVIHDTDHFAAYRHDPRFPWRSFLRGHHPIVIDRLDDLSQASPFTGIRRALGQVRRASERVELTRMTPRRALASTGYCLADPANELLVWVPGGGPVEVDLGAAPGDLEAEWLDVARDTLVAGGAVAGGARRTLQAPFAGSALLHIRRPAGTPELAPASTTRLEGRVGEPFGPFRITAPGVGSLRDVRVAHGTLPAGLSLDATGALAGTPTATGTVEVTVTAPTPAGALLAARYTIVVGRRARAPAGGVAFERIGRFHAASPLDPTRIINVDVPPNRAFSRMEVTFDVTHGGWHGPDRAGLHNLIWIQRGRYGVPPRLFPRWQGNIFGYLNARGPGRNLVHARTEATTKTTGARLEPGRTYRVRWVYRNDRIEETVTDRGTGRVVATIADRSPQTALRSPADGAFMLYFGNGEPGAHGPEVPSFGWTWSDLTVELTP